MAGRTQRELASEIGVLRKLRPNLNKAVSHLILSQDPTQRDLTEKEWKVAIEIALSEHGASGAMFASWIHTDTQVQHCHLLFCRILPTSDVVTDSHNYLKNKAAARRIEEKFMLDAPIITPLEGRPGNRQKLQNAARRADRLNIQGPERIDAKLVRDALAESTNQVDFANRLQASGLEVEFQRRGERREIFGWKLRPAGADYWVKASTLAKDLSWPKISHRFLDSPAPAPVSEVENAVPTLPALAAAPQEGSDRRVVDDRDDRDDRAARLAKVPAMIRESFELDDIDPAQSGQSSLQTAQERISRLDIGPVSKVMLTLGAAAVHLTAEALKALLNFVKKVLAKFGIELRPLHHQSVVTEPAPQLLDYRPVFKTPNQVLRSFSEVDPARAAAAQLLQVQAAVEQNNADLLPQVEGAERERMELVSTLQYPDEGAAAAAAAAAVQGPTPTPAPAVARPPVVLEAAITSCQTAALEHLEAAWRVVDYRVQAAAAETQNRTALLKEAKLKMKAASEQLASWKAAHPFKTALGRSAEQADLQQKVDQARGVVDSMQAELNAARLLSPPTTKLPDLSTAATGRRAEFMDSLRQVQLLIHDKIELIQDAAEKEKLLKAVRLPVAAFAKLADPLTGRFYNLKSIGSMTQSIFKVNDEIQRVLVVQSNRAAQLAAELDYSARQQDDERHVPERQLPLPGVLPS